MPLLYTNLEILANISERLRRTVFDPEGLRPERADNFQFFFGGKFFSTFTKRKRPQVKRISQGANSTDHSFLALRNMITAIAAANRLITSKNKLPPVLRGEGMMALSVINGLTTRAATKIQSTKYKTAPAINN